MQHVYGESPSENSTSPARGLLIDSVDKKISSTEISGEMMFVSAMKMMGTSPHRSRTLLTRFNVPRTLEVPS